MAFPTTAITDDTQLYFSFQPDDPTVTARIAAYLSDISSWMMDHHLQLNLAKTELLVFSANPSLHHNFSIQLGSSTITPSRTARNLGVVIDDQLSFTGTLATNSRSHQIQGTDVCLQDHNWHCTNIPKLASSNLCALQKLAFCK